jgi:hypothetical protein
MSGMRSTKGDYTTLRNGMPSLRTRKVETQTEEREVRAQIRGGSRKEGRSDRASALHNRHEEIHASGSGPENGEVTVESNQRRRWRVQSPSGHTRT